MGWLGWRTSRGAISAQVCSFQARRGGGGREGRTAMEAATAAEVAFSPSSAPREHSSGEKVLPTTDTLCGERGGGAAPGTPQRGPSGAGPALPCPAEGSLAEPGAPNRAVLGRARPGHARPAAAEPRALLPERRCRSPRPARTRCGGAAPARHRLRRGCRLPDTPAANFSRAGRLLSVLPCPLRQPRPRQPRGRRSPTGLSPGRDSHRELLPTAVAQGRSPRWQP